MRVAISTDQGYVSAHFGRCSTYTILEIKDGQILSREEIPNPGHRPGFLPQFLSGKGVTCIIAGGMGPRAQSLFVQRNIETITGVQGSVEEVIDKFLKQELEPGEDLCDHEHGRQEHYGCEDEPTHPSLSAGAKIAITTKGPDLGADIDPNFGRASYLLIIDPKTMLIEALVNPHRDLSQGAGIQTAQLVVQHGVGTLMTGECGPNALLVLNEAGVHIISRLQGRAQDALSEYMREK